MLACLLYAEPKDPLIAVKNAIFRLSIQSKRLFKERSFGQGMAAQRYPGAAQGPQRFCRR